MPKFYIKKLTPQELGYRSGRPKGGGRYFYVSKDCLEFFPPLSENILNDSVLIPIIPPFSNNKVYSNFVYHNDKHAIENGTRDEYRLYLNKQIDPNGEYFSIDDIVVFEKQEEKIDQEIIPTYFLNRFLASAPEYNILNNIIEKSEIRGGHALYDGELSVSTQTTKFSADNRVIIPEEVEKEVKDKLTENEEEMGAHLFNSISFRDFVLNSYGYKCAITNKSITWKNLNNLEAAHIKPKSHRGSFLPCNGIALSRDMHWAFDKGFISINDDYTVLVHKDVKETMLKEIDGKKINLPIEDFFKPNKEYLKHHRENVFGLFHHSGSLRSIN
ncbi:MAG: HNH endonuclease [Patescibacteria group bacterium]